jgi:hypothetical protein
MSDTFSLEKVYEVWNDKHGSKTEVGPDRDSLNLIEIRDYDTKNKIQGRIVMQKNQAILVVEALQLAIKDCKDD